MGTLTTALLSSSTNAVLNGPSMNLPAPLTPTTLDTADDLRFDALWGSHRSLPEKVDFTFPTQALPV
jgi:hypothetical protein